MNRHQRKMIAIAMSLAVMLGRLSSAMAQAQDLSVSMASSRSAFYRMEPDAKIRMRLANTSDADAKDLKVNLTLRTIWTTLGSQAIEVASVRAKGETEIEYDLDTHLRPDEYMLKVSVQAAGKDPQNIEFPIHLVARPPEVEMPVVLWGAVPLAEVSMVKELGFTHFFVVAPDYQKVFEAGAVTSTNSVGQTAKVRQLMDDALRQGLRCGAFLSPGNWWGKNQTEALRTGRDGKPLAEKNANGLYPQIQEFAKITAESLIKSFGDAPNFECALINTEMRDGAEVSFSSTDIEAYRKFSGQSIPSEVQTKRGVDYRTIKGFPADRVIADDHPIYRYYQWYWTRGDGWNDLNAACQDGLRKALKPNQKFWTWHDPAVRVASVYGSSVATDYLGQWTYSTPDPLKILLVDDEMKAMAAGSGREQKLITGTQLIWYRSQSVGSNSGVSTFSDRDTGGQSRLISAAPMSVRQSVWCSLAQPIDALYFHGWQSLVPVKSEYGYAYTNSQLQHELSRLIKESVAPLGPTLLQLKEPQGDVAFLESFASQMFAGRGNYGWSTGWIGDAYQILAYSGLQPHVVYEQTIQSGGLSSCKILVMTDCDVLPESVAKEIAIFQQRGGIVVADEHVCPAVRPDIVLPAYARTGDPQKDKPALLDRAQKLKTALTNHYRSSVQSQNPEVVIRRRVAGDAQYIFAINDHREAGDYVGQFGRVMEIGLPAETTLTFGGKGVVYDARAGRRIDTAASGSELTFQSQLAPGDGGLYVVLPKAIEMTELKLPESAKRGETVQLRVAIADAEGAPVNAAVPVQLMIQDSEGRDAERSGYYAAVKGELDVAFDLAANDRIGLWRIDARNGLTGTVTTRYLRVK